MQPRVLLPNWLIGRWICAAHVALCHPSLRISSILIGRFRQDCKPEQSGATVDIVACAEEWCRLARNLRR